MEARQRALLTSLSAVALAGVITLATGADRLPSWSWTIGGVAAEVGPGRTAVDVGDTAAATPGDSSNARQTGRANSGAGASGPSAVPAATRLERNPTGQPGQSSAAPGSRYVFATYAEAEEFAAKTRAHLLQPHWVPPGFDEEPLTVTLSTLTPEQASYLGRVQRIGAVQRFTAADGQFTIVQSVPPPAFDLYMMSTGGEDEAVLASGQRVQVGQYPQGVIVFWHERGDARSVSIIGDLGAAQRLPRADWLHIAESLS